MRKFIVHYLVALQFLTVAGGSLALLGLLFLPNDIARGASVFAAFLLLVAGNILLWGERCIKRMPC